MKNVKDKNDKTVSSSIDINREHSSSFSKRTLLMYLSVGFIGMFIVATLWYAKSTSSRIASQYSPLIHVAMEIKFNAATAHLLFEEIISGDNTEDINKVWKNLDISKMYAQTMLKGSESFDEGTYVPLTDLKLRQDVLVVLDKIEEFRAVAKERLVIPEKSPAGSEIDQRFDIIFNSFLKQTDEVETAIQKRMNFSIKRFQTVQTILIVLSILITGIIGVILYFYGISFNVYVPTVHFFMSILPGEIY